MRNHVKAREYKPVGESQDGVENVNRAQRRARGIVLPKTKAIQSTLKRKAARQETLDHLERVAEQDRIIKPANSTTTVKNFGPKDSLAHLPEAFILQEIMKDPGCKVVAKMAKCSLESAAEMIKRLVDSGEMLMGYVDGELRVGMAHKGWKAVSARMR
jgi:hypothetical protein